MRHEPRLDPAALRTARMQAGLTQHQLARLIGVAGGERVSRWELGTSAPRSDILRRIASTLQMGVTDLLESTAESPDLRSLRVRAGLSLEDVAKRAHVSKSTLSRWESGRVVKTPDRAAFTELAHSLGVTVDEVARAFERSRAGD